MNSQETERYVEDRRPLLSEKDARAFLGDISRPTLTRIRQRREIAEVKIGRRVFFRLDDLEDYIERNREPVVIP